METIMNIHKEWERLFGKYLQKPQETYQITVIMDPRIVESDDTSSLTDVTNLRYVFPLADWLQRNGRVGSGKPLEVNIKMQVGDGNMERVQSFLANAGNLSHIQFQVNDEQLTLPPWEPGRIFPICQVSNQEISDERAPDYKGLRYSVDYSGEGGNHLPAARMMFELEKRLLEYINDPKVYIGTSSLKIKAEDKKRLQTDINKKIEPYFQEMDVLSLVIWLFLLRELIESKQLYALGEKGLGLQINEEIVTKSRMDAVSYGEAIYQLIENSCLHATSHRAWFGFRVHRAGRNVPMSELGKETGSRRRLYEKYRSCFTSWSRDNRNGEDRFTARPDSLFAKDNRYFFEFFVLDGAWDQSGMTEDYNKKRLQEKCDELWKKRGNQEALTVEKKQDLEKEAKDALESEGSLVSSIAELLRLRPKREHTQRYIEDITVHYGLRLLQRIVAVNGGYLMSRTPGTGGSGLYYFNGNEIPVPRWEFQGTIYMTEWNGLLPVSYHWVPIQDSSAQKFSADNCFEEQISQRRERVCYLNCDEIFQQMERNLEKVQSIKQFGSELYSRLPWENRHKLSSSVLLLRTDSPQLYQLELFAKALFSCIARTTHRGGEGAEKPAPVRIAVLLPTTDTLHELLRLFSVFYIGGEQPDMEDVQVAFCTRKRESGLYRVNFILAGSSLSSAFEAAKLFAYHHSEDALEHLPLLDYLTNQVTRAEGGSGAVVPPLYPFDLFLPVQLPEEGSGEIKIDPWRDSWFLEYIKFRLNRDIRDSGDGCMIDGIHARLGSKLHLGRFFEGELLFHDMGNILRFAYLLAYQLLYGEDILLERQHVVLLGYEKYSTTLMLQLEKWLKRSNRFSAVHTAIIYDGEEDADVVVEPCYSVEEKVPDGGIQIVTVMPMGTTLSTVYKMYHVAHKDLRLLSSNSRNISKEHMKNFCLVLVNQDLFRKNDISDVTKRYWVTAKREKRIVTVREEVGEGERQEVRYLLAAEAEWLAPETCHICRLSGKETRAIIDAKNSNTMLSSIFTLWEKREGRFYDLLPDGDIKENRQRIQALFGAIHYSHIYEKNNHFQFYLDFAKLYYEHQEEIDRAVAGWTVPADAFHVVVSPLQFSNAPFLKSVLDQVFHGSARFLHIDLKDSYREEIRMKFVYIAEEFQHMRRVSPNVKFCVHFVDTSIVTGGTLTRAKLLMRMLLHQVGCLDENAELFSKVFLLVNRCSYATVQSFVRDPRQDMRAYIYLAIPSYNTENDFCPACRQVKRYHLLQKRSATERLSSEFERLEKKHKKRTVGEYNRWLDKTILDGSSYFAWLRQWLYVGLPDITGEDQKGKHPQIIAFVPKGIVTVTKADKQSEYQQAEYVCNEIEGYVGRRMTEVREARADGASPAKQLSHQEILDELSGMCLRDVVKYIERHGEASQNGGDEEDWKRAAKKFKKTAVRVVRTYLIHTRNYMRLYSMQRAYEELELANSGPAPGEAGSGLDEQTRRAMLCLIAEGIGTLAENQGGFSQEHYERVQFVNRFEWIVSYIKVLSREQIAKYYHCRRAIMGIMNDIMRLLYVKNASCNTVNNGQKWEQAADELEREDRNWSPIIQVVEWLCGTAGGGPDAQLRAHLEYQLTTMLLHRTADLQLGFVTQSDNIAAFLRRYYELVDQCFAPWEKEQKVAVPRCVLPPYRAVILRYLKSVKAAVMTSEDDTPCLALAKVPGDIVRMSRQEGKQPLTPEQTDVWLLFARYIYLENSRMLYSGMRDLELKLPKQALKAADSRRPADHFNDQMADLSKAVDACLEGCYQEVGRDIRENDILYQNILGNLCRFWHRTSTQLPVQAKGGGKKKTAPANTIAYLLQYFRRVTKLFKETASIDELPYRYEELCHIICGLTGYTMCYIAFRSKDAAPQIFTQSGYHVETMRRKKILTAARLDDLLHQMDQVRQKAQERLSGVSDEVPEQVPGERFGQMLIPGVTHFQTVGGGEEFLIVTVSRREEPLGSEKFHIVLQGERTKEDWERQKSEKKDAQLLCLKALEKARNILFMRRRLKDILSRDYTLLHSLRFDCSYVRPICDEPNRKPCLLHISDLHIKEDLTGGENCKADRLIEKLGENLGRNAEEEPGSGEEQIDLLAITGDIVDGREANAPQMEQNYQYAEELLNRMAILIWENEDGYLPHDWRRRVILTTGNHDYAAMNQFKAIVKRRALASGLPVESESGTMSKFAYYIDFLIRYLDPPIDELIANDLNEIRHYRKLNIKVLVLNCSGNAVPRRTNKMGVNQEKVMTLLKQRNWNQDPEQSGVFRLCLAHYAPGYELSYFLDDYDVLPGWEWRLEKQKVCPINALVTSFCKCVEHEIRARYVKPLSAGSGGEKGTERPEKEGESPDQEGEKKKDPAAEEAARVRKEFLDQFKALGRALDALESGGNPTDSASDKICDRLKEGASKDQGAEIAAKMRKNELYRQIKNFCDWLEEPDGCLNREPISQLLYEVQECVTMSQQDKLCFEHLLEKVKRNLYLAGHIHAYADTTDGILVADRFFYEKDDNIQGYVINLRKETKDNPRRYTFRRLV